VAAAQLMARAVREDDDVAWSDRDRDAVLHAIGFVGNVAVPTTLDGEAPGPWLTALLTNVGLLTVFAAQHSVMARRWFKRAWTRIVSPSIERSTYLLCASLALLLLFWQWRPMGMPIWTIEHPVGRIVMWTLFAAGWATVLGTTFLIDHFDLFGLRQVWLAFRGHPHTRGAFRTPWPYRYVRRPLYLAFLFAFWMTPTMTLAHLVFAIATTAHIVLAIQFEERDLVAEHGPFYAAYRRSVPMLLPSGRGGRDAPTARRDGADALVTPQDV
jgi:methanethiol S-methyltransferase